MKLTTIGLMVLLPLVCFGQGKFAGSYRALVGKHYTDIKQLTLLQGFAQRSGTVVGDPSDERGLSINWYRRGPLIVVLFESKEANAKDHVIIDVVEIRAVEKNQELKVGTCQDGENPMPGLVALVQTATGKTKALRAWNANLDKLYIDTWPADKVTCLAEGDDD